MAGKRTVGLDGGDVVAHFRDVMTGSRNEEIDPHSCIPFVKLRRTTKSGVIRMAAIFTGSARSKLGPAAAGIACGADSPLVVELSGAMLSYVRDHFTEKGLKGDEVEEKVRSRTIWYGIIDGVYRQEAIMVLMNSTEKWAHFRWYVTIVNSGFPLERYRQLARLQNLRHSSLFYIEFTYADILVNLRMEYDRLSQQEGKITAAKVAREFDGNGNLSTASIRQTAHISIRLPESVIRAINTVTNTENAQTCLQSTDLNTVGATSSEEIMSLLDCRPYAKIFHSSSLKSATLFLKGEETAQVNTIYRCKDHFQNNNFRTLSSVVVCEMYTNSIFAIQEEKKFLEYINDKTWPSGMETLRDNLLRTCTLDDELKENRGNDHDILQSLKDAFYRYFPELSKICDRRKKGILEGDTVFKNFTVTESTKSSCSMDDNLSYGDDRDEIGIDKIGTDNCKETRAGMVEVLQKKGITCHNTTWQAFLREKWSEDSSKFDYVFTDPPSAPSRSYLRFDKRVRSKVIEEIGSKEISEMASFCKKVLKSGGYITILMEFYMFPEWYLAFTKEGFSVMTYPFPITFNPDTIPKRPTKEYPRNIQQYALIGRAPGKHPSRFYPSFDGTFADINSSLSRANAIITNATWPTKKLMRPNTKQPFRTSEKSAQLISCFVDLFTPPEGSTIDPYGGTLTLPIAAMAKSRTCVAIEKDSECFDVALKRLCGFATPITDHIMETTMDERKNMLDAVQKMCERDENVEDNFDDSIEILGEEDLQCTEKSNETSGTIFCFEGSHGYSENTDLNNIEKSVTGKRVYGGIPLECPASKIQRLESLHSATESQHVCFENLRGLKTVYLLLGGSIVGTAGPQPSSNGEKGLFRRRLHGYDLRNLQEDGQYLISITKINIIPGKKHLIYPFACPGQEEKPTTLGDMFSNGMYTWDAHQISESR